MLSHRDETGCAKPHLLTVKLGKHTSGQIHALLQRIFPTQGSSPGLRVSCVGRQSLYHCTTWDPHGAPLFQAEGPCIRLPCVRCWTFLGTPASEGPRMPRSRWQTSPKGQLSFSSLRQGSLCKKWENRRLHIWTLPGWASHLPAPMDWDMVLHAGQQQSPSLVIRLIAMCQQPAGSPSFHWAASISKETTEAESGLPA